MKKRIIIIILILMISACNLPNGIALTGSVTPTSTPLPSLTPTITETPTPIPTITPTPQPVARIQQADWMLFLGDYESARAEYQAAMAADKSSEIQAAALIGLGRVEYLSGNTGAAMNQFNAVIKTYPKSSNLANAYYFLAQCYLTLQNPTQAANAYASYLLLRPNIVDAYIQEARGDALMAAGDTADAISSYQAAQQAPQLGDSLDIKIGQAYLAQKDYQEAVRRFMAIYNTTTNDYIKAQMNLLTGRAYLAMGLPEQAYARFQDSVLNFPKAYDTYTGLVILVDANQPVNDLDRGIVDYYAEKYALAVDAFNRYLKNTPDHDGTVHYYKALSLLAQEQYDAAVNELQSLITDYPQDRFYTATWEEIAYTQWADLDQYAQAATTLLTFVQQNPAASQSPQFLFEAARVLERSNRLEDAAAVWMRIITEYPTSDLGYRALFLAGISYYRIPDFTQALTTFQQLLVLATTPDEQAAAYFWIGKSQQSQADMQGAKSSWQLAAERDPTGYYSERAKEILNNQQPFTSTQYNTVVPNLEQERVQAEAWMRTTFAIPAETDLSNLGALAGDARVLRGDEFWHLGLYQEASDEFENLREEIKADPANNFRLLGHLLGLGLYRSAILTSRQILTLAGMDDAGTLAAPDYFNHIRFGTYFQEIIIPEAQTKDLPPFLIFSIIRQESMFEGFVQSSAGAIGLMQIMPATGQEIVANMGWPPNYTSEDLFRPYVNVRLATRYLARQRDYLDGDLYAMLAAYNGGPGNAMQWKKLSNDDPDLFLEVIRFDETRNYIMYIYEFMSLYQKIYQRGQ